MNVMRKKIADAIIRTFARVDNVHGYDPDTCYEAADEVIAELMTVLSGTQYRATFTPGIISPAKFAEELK